MRSSINNETFSTSKQVKIASDSSSSDEGTKRHKCFSSMSNSPEVISDVGEKKNNNRLIELENETKTIEQLKRKLKKLTKKSKKATEQICNLIHEKKNLGMKLAEWKEKPNQTDHSSRIGELKNMLQSEKRMLEEKEKDVKNLWSAIQTLDDENVKLDRDTEEWKGREKEMNGEITGLKKALKNTKKQQSVGDDLYISHNTDNWRFKMESDLKRYKAKGSCRRSSSDNFKAKLGGWRENKIMMNFWSTAKDGKKSRREGDYEKLKTGRTIGALGKDDTLNSKATTGCKTNALRGPMKIVSDRWRKEEEPTSKTLAVITAYNNFLVTQNICL